MYTSVRFVQNTYGCMPVLDLYNILIVVYQCKICTTFLLMYTSVRLLQHSYQYIPDLDLDFVHSYGYIPVLDSYRCIPVID